MRATSVKWIQVKDSEEGRSLVTGDIGSVFSPVRDQPCNIISIFGRARQGKSFLMNCLSGEREIFQVSNEKDSCTQGIDISTKWVDMKTFSTIDRGTEVNGPTRIGFVDAEGQGDRDVSYDANLVCPILLTSKCVIFNWKGDLQKDHILNTLGIMTRAARNVASETEDNGTAKKFGHLHICFRDWQAVESSEKSVYEALFNPETAIEAETRNQIRKEVKACFASINIWLFDAPVDSVQDLKKKLTMDMTSTTFRDKLRVLRHTLANQLREPTMIAGRPITGFTMGLLVRQIAQTLNRGEAILPSSAYVTMMQQEVQQLTQQFHTALQAKLQAVIVDFKAKSRGTDFPSLTEAQEIYEKAFMELEVKLNEDVAAIVGDTNTRLGKEIIKVIPTFLAQIKEASSQQYYSAYNANLSQLLMILGERADQIIHVEIQKLKDIKVGPLDAEQIQMSLNKLLESARDLMGGNKYSGEQLEVRLDSIRRLIESNSEQIINIHQVALQKFSAEADVILAEMKRIIHGSIGQSLDEILSFNPNGVPRAEIEKSLNSKYSEMKESFSYRCPNNPFVERMKVEFRNYCSSLREVLCQMYDDRLRASFQAIQQVIQQKIQEHTDMMKEEELFDSLWETVSESVDLINNSEVDCITHLHRQMADWFQSNMDESLEYGRERVNGWDNSANLYETVEQNILEFANNHLSEVQDAISARYMERRQAIVAENRRAEDRQRQLAADAAAAAAAEKQERERQEAMRQEALKREAMRLEKERQLELEAIERQRLQELEIQQSMEIEEQEAEEQVVTKGRRSRTSLTAPPKKVALSVEEQRERARRYAEEQGFLSAKPKKAAKAKAEETTVRKSSVAEQRMRAAQYAKEQFNLDIACEDNGTENVENYKKTKKSGDEEILKQTRAEARKSIDSNIQEATTKLRNTRTKN